MATKEEIIQSIKSLAENNSISKEEIINAFNEVPRKEEQPVSKKLGMAEILYYIGGAIVFFGVVIFVQQNWNALNTFTRIISTLGSAVVAYLLAVFLGTNKKTENVSIAFHLIAALVLPMGLFITFHEAGLDIGTSGMQAFISMILTLVYIFSFVVLRKNIFILFSIIFSTWLFFSFTGYMIEGVNTISWVADFFSYRIMAVGLAYVLLGYYFSNNRRAFSGFLYGFGVLGFLGSAMILQGWKPEQKLFWEIIYPGLIFVVLFLSVYIKSRAFLTFGTIFLMVYITKITAEYFSGSMGWPLSLVIIGFLLIASGYLFIFMKNRYMPKIDR